LLQSGNGSSAQQRTRRCRIPADDELLLRDAKYELCARCVPAGKQDDCDDCKQSKPVSFINHILLFCRTIPKGFNPSDQGLVASATYPGCMDFELLSRAYHRLPWRLRKAAAGGCSFLGRWPNFSSRQHNRWLSMHAVLAFS
jgi:hypothetical protein